MGVSTLANKPMKFTLPNGKAYEVKKLSILEIFGEIESDIKAEWLANINSIASSLPVPDRKSFLTGIIRDMPAGAVLERLAQAKMETVAGGFKMLKMVLSRCQEIENEELQDLVGDSANQDIIDQIMNYAVGADSQAQDPTQKKTVVGEAETTTGASSSPSLPETVVGP